MGRFCLGLSLFKHNQFSHLKCGLRGLKMVDTGEVIYKDPPNYDYFGKYPSPLKLLPSSNRLVENSKVLVVEGNVASGKARVAKTLAKYFGLVHFEDPTEANIYTSYNHDPPFDLRQHNYLLTDSSKYYTGEMLWNEPDLINNGKAVYLQLQYYANRYWVYLKSLCTLFNTGQGVVMDRSPFSDFAFIEAMRKCGLVSEEAANWFKKQHGITADLLWKPHVIVYVKSSNDQIREHIKRRNIPWEVNALNLNDEFFNALTNVFEQYYLAEMSRFSYVYVLDRSAVDIYDDYDMYEVAAKISEYDFVLEHALRDDLLLFEWRVGLKDWRCSWDSKAYFSNAFESFDAVFNLVKFPFKMPELRYNYDERELQQYLMDIDPRTEVPPSYNTRYSSLFSIMFNPWHMKENYHIDMPKRFLWV